MSSPSRRAPARALALLATVWALAAARDAGAQAWFYPSFQTPQTADREYNFAAIAAGGANFLFQWREGISPGTQLSLDAGIADGEGPSNTKVYVGGQYARELARATEQQPIDLLLTAGAGIAVGNGPGLFRIPVGVSVGHRFPLDRDMWITPYVHPRASLDVWTSDRGNGGSRLTLDFDVGGKLEITRELAIRASLVVSGHDVASSTGFGIGLSWAPAPLASPAPLRGLPRIAPR